MVIAEKIYSLESLGHVFQAAKVCEEHDVPDGAKYVGITHKKYR